MTDGNPPVGDPMRQIVQTMAEKCDTCIFRPGNLMHLEPGRVKELTDAALANEGHITCHKTLTWQLGAVCRGFIEADKHGRSLAMRVIELGIATEVQVDGTGRGRGAGQPTEENVGADVPDPGGHGGRAVD